MQLTTYEPRTSTAGQAPCVSTEFGMIQTAWRTEDILKLAEQTFEAHVPAEVEDVPDDAGAGEPFLACKLDWETWPCAASVLAEKYITMVGEYLVTGYWELRAERLITARDPDAAGPCTGNSRKLFLSWCQTSRAIPQTSGPP